MLKPQNVPYGRHNDYIRYIDRNLSQSSKVELSCQGKGSVSYGLGADFSLPHCLVPGGQVSENNLEPSPDGKSADGKSDPRAEISG